MMATGNGPKWFLITKHPLGKLVELPGSYLFFDHFFFFCDVFFREHLPKHPFLGELW